MRIITILILLLIPVVPSKAQKYMTKTGHINFYSHTPLEDINADNNQAASVVDLSTGEVVFQVLIKSFKFEKALMEEHFNENYLESDKYPRATFRGKITDPAPAVIAKGGKHEVTVEGDLNLHNVTNRITAKGTVEVMNETMNAVAKFEIRPEDYNIEIPSVVRDNIAKTMGVTVDMKYTRTENK